MILLIVFFLGVVSTGIVCLASKQRATYKELTIYEVPDGMVPVDRDRLMEIERSFGPDPLDMNGYPYRREVRLYLESVRDQFQRMLINAARPKYWAVTDCQIVKENQLEPMPEAQELTRRLVANEAELRRVARWVLFRIWLWNVSGFHKRAWGPIPTSRMLRIPQVLESYEMVKLAAISLARSYGEAVVSQEIAESM